MHTLCPPHHNWREGQRTKKNYAIGKWLFLTKSHSIWLHVLNYDDIVTNLGIFFNSKLHTAWNWCLNEEQWSWMDEDLYCWSRWSTLLGNIFKTWRPSNLICRQYKKATTFPSTRLIYWAQLPCALLWVENEDLWASSIANWWHKCQIVGIYISCFAYPVNSSTKPWIMEAHISSCQCKCNIFSVMSSLLNGSFSRSAQHHYHGC